VCTDELSGHKPNVSMESIPIAGARRRVCTRADQGEIRLADDTIEVENERGIATRSMSSRWFRIDGHRRAVDRPREEEEAKPARRRLEWISERDHATARAA